VRKNRKKAERYRFNGHPSFCERSIHSFEVADLEEQVRRFESKLADPDDRDDRNWTSRWLLRYRRELEKKRTGRQLKRAERRRHRRPGA
jgi:hypothetical protein